MTDETTPAKQTTTDRRQRSFRVESIVLRHQDYGEADRFLVLFTRERGKLRAIAKGVRKPHSRKAGHLEPFMRASLQLARGRDLVIVTQAETLDAYLPLREDILLATYASYVVELLDRFTFEEGENPAMYRLLRNTLARLSVREEPELVVRYYEMRLLDLLGYRPKLFFCAGCEEEIEPRDQYFSAERGGVLCPSCGARTSRVRPVSMTVLKYLRHLQRSSFREASRIRLSDAEAQQMEQLMQHYLTYLLERGLNSPAFLRNVKKFDE